MTSIGRPLFFFSIGPTVLAAVWAAILLSVGSPSAVHSATLECFLTLLGASGMLVGAGLWREDNRRQA